MGFGPGWIDCTFSKEKSDSGWDYVGVVSTEDYVGGASSGGGVSSGVIMLFKRTIVDEHECKCCIPSGVEIKDRTKQYKFLRTITYPDSVLWIEFPMAWPPLNLTDVISDIIIGEVMPPQPSSDDLKDILKDSNDKPKKSETGELVKDSGVPTKFCIWK